MKELNKFEIWQGTENIGGSIKRVSRWIRINQNCNPRKNNVLWDYVTDGSGYNPHNDSFNPADGLYLDYFTYGGRNYALDQFIRFGSIADSIGHFEGYIENGEKYYLSGWDSCGSFFGPVLMIELDEYCEHVRVYEG